MFIDLLFHYVEICRKSIYWYMIIAIPALILLMYYFIPEGPIPTPVFLKNRMLDVALAMGVLAVSMLIYDVLKHPKLGNLYPIPHLILFAGFAAATIIEVVTLFQSVF